MTDTIPEIRPGVWQINDFFTESYAADAFEGKPEGWNPIGKPDVAMVVLQDQWTLGGNGVLDHRHVLRARVVEASQ